VLAGRLNTHVGMVYATNFIRTSFAAMDMFLLAQFEHFLTILCFVDLNYSLLILPSGIGLHNCIWHLEVF
jgi:hypothetical protein